MERNSHWSQGVRNGQELVSHPAEVVSFSPPRHWKKKTAYAWALSNKSDGWQQDRQEERKREKERERERERERENTKNNNTESDRETEGGGGETTNMLAHCQKHISSTHRWTSDQLSTIQSYARQTPNTVTPSSFVNMDAAPLTMLSNSQLEKEPWSSLQCLQEKTVYTWSQITTKQKMVNWNCSMLMW